MSNDTNDLPDTSPQIDLDRARKALDAFKAFAERMKDAPPSAPEVTPQWEKDTPVWNPETNSFDVPDECYATPDIVYEEKAEEIISERLVEKQLEPDPEVRRRERLTRSGNELSPHTLMKLEEQEFAELRRQAGSRTPGAYAPGFHESQRKKAELKRWDDTFRAHAEADAAIAGQPCSLQITGTIQIGNAPYDEGRRLIIDQAMQIMQELGFKPVYGPPLVDADAGTPRIRRWTNKRVSQQYLYDLVFARGAATAHELVGPMYGEPDWSVEEQEAALKKLRAALSRAVKERVLDRRRLPTGETIYAIRGRFDEGMAIRESIEAARKAALQNPEQLKLPTDMNDMPIEVIHGCVRRLQYWFGQYCTTYDQDFWRDIGRDVVYGAFNLPAHSSIPVPPRKSRTPTRTLKLPATTPDEEDAET